MLLISVATNVPVHQTVVIATRTVVTGSQPANAPEILHTCFQTVRKVVTSAKLDQFGNHIFVDVPINLTVLEVYF